MISKLDLQPKGQGHRKKQNIKPRKQKHATSKKIEQGFSSK